MRAFLWLSIAAAAALRLAILAAGPDLDTDAFGHAMAGRFLLLDPADLRIHWVWLPLWHGVHALIAAAGGGLDEARALNVALGVAPPLLLARLLRRPGGEELGAMAGALLALWPLGMGLGQSAQPEPLFQALALGACVAWEEERPALAGGLLSAAALCRYEAWVLPPVYLALWWRRGRKPRGALAWVLPGLAAGAWCAAHGAASGEFLKFLRENREFARDALDRLGYPWGREPSFAIMALWYPVIRPATELLFFAPFTAAGVAVAWRRRWLPPALLWPSVVVLLFLSYGWVMRLNLGLQRHFYALVPLYAALTASGLLAAAEALRRRGRAPRWPLAPLALALFFATRTAPVARWNFWMSRAAFPGPRASAEALRREGPGPRDRFVCDLAPVELLGRLPRAQVLRRPASSLVPADAAALAPGGRLFVVARPADAAALRTSARVLFEDQDGVALVLPP